MSDILERLKQRALAARAEKGATALGDALHFEEAAAEIERLRAEVEQLRWSLDVETQAGHPVHARLAAVEVVRTLLDAYSAYFPPGNPWADKVRETLGIETKAAPEGHDPTNPFAPRPRPQKSIRLMNDAERRTAGLDPNGGFDGPTGAE